MKKKMNRGFALFLAALMATGMIPAQPVMAENAAEENGTQIEAVEVDEESRVIEATESEETDSVRPETYADDELVTVIVELSDAPVLDYYGVSTYAADADSDAGEAVSDFLTSDAADAIAEEITAQQDEMIQEISSEADVKEVVDQWASVTNAVAITVPYGDLAKIQKMDGVRRAYVEHVFDRPDEPVTKEAGEIAGYSYDMVGIQEAWGEGYTGKGMLVAVLDTGLDINWQAGQINEKDKTHVITSHEAFRDDSFKSADAKEELRYTSESIKKFLEDNTLNAEFRGGNQELTYDYNALYKNEKVPFAYDYADLDLNVQPGSSTHGTHVAGTVAGYVKDAEGKVKFSGVAPDAQLLIMKVFPDADGGAQESDMIAALEDAVKLGADVINLSLGSDNGFGKDDTIQEELYDRVREAGILLMTSAGNSASSSANNNYGGNNLTSDPETSMMSSPAVYDSNLAVASINNSVDVVSVFEWTDKAGEVHRVAYNDPNESSMKFKFLGKEMNIIPVGGVGTTEDYEKAGFRSYYGYGDKGVTGIALVQRGEISFTDKIKNASSFTWNYYDSSSGNYVNYSPVQAVLVYDNVEGDLITMSTDGTYLTSAFISKADGEAIINAINDGCEVKISVQKDDELVKWDKQGQMSEFTSWGAGPNLELKPEITAPGGNIWSSVVDDSSRLNNPSDYNGSYGMMSGTSMAAPHMTGITALVEQYVQTEHNNGTKTTNADLTSLLLMSTAIPQKQEDGNYYSPRVQGAGLANAAAAIKTPAYITVAGQSVGKLELKDDPEKTGSYDLKFTVHNLSRKKVSYKAKAVFQYPATASVDTEWGTREVMLDADQKLGEFDLGTVTVAGSSSTDIAKNVTLSAEQRAALDTFANGTYVEGYVILEAEDDSNPQIGLPVLAFYGDWTSAPIFDNGDWLDTPEDGTTVLNNEATWRISDVAYYDGYSFYTLGLNPFDAHAAQNYANFHDGNITLAPGTGLYRSINDFVLYQLRQAKAVIVEVHNSETGELYYHDLATYQLKTTYNASYATAIPTSVSYFTQDYWSGTDLEGNVLPSGTQCKVTITAYGDGEYPTENNETLGRVATDFEALIPGEVEPSFNGHKMDMTGDVIEFSVLVDTEAPVMTNNAVSCKEVDGRTIVSGSFNDDNGSIASIAIYPQVKRTYKEGYGDPSYVEYGLDKINPFYDELVNEEDVHQKGFSCDVTEYVHTNESYPGENSYYDYEWTGNLYVFCGDYGGNDRSYAVKVNTDPGIVLSQTSALLDIGDQFNLSVIDNTDANGVITRTSSNPEVATVDETGLVTAVGAGQTIITVGNGTGTAICVVAVNEKNAEVESFDLSIDSFSGLKPNGAVIVNVKNIQPSGVEINSVEWKTYEDDPDLYTGLLTVAQHTTDAMSGEVYLNASASGDDDLTIPGSSGYLEVTLNREVDENGNVVKPGVTRTMRLDWDDLYHQTTDEDLTSDLFGGQQTVYVQNGETATLIAKYNDSNRHQAIDVKLYSPVGATNYSYTNPTAASTGLVLDGPDFASVGSEWRGRLVNEAGYKLPESVQIGSIIPYSDGSMYESWWDNNYGYFTYNAETGEIVVKNAPYGSNNQMVIRADGVVSEGNPAGTRSDVTYTRPEPLYGPFDWNITGERAVTGELTTAENVNINGDTKNVAYYTPSEPGVTYITATTKDGAYSVNFAVISEGILADTLTLDTNKVTLTEGESYQLTATLDPEPTLDLNKELVWKSFNPEVAMVDENGVITAVAEGDAYIKVNTKTAPERDAETQSYCIVHVNGPVKYSVTFCDYDGTVLDTQVVRAGENATAPQTPEREGYTFAGWDKDFTNVTANLTVTATYTKNEDPSNPDDGNNGNQPSNPDNGNNGNGGNNGNQPSNPDNGNNGNGGSNGNQPSNPDTGNNGNGGNNGNTGTNNNGNNNTTANADGGQAATAQTVKTGDTGSLAAVWMLLGGIMLCMGAARMSFKRRRNK